MKDNGGALPPFLNRFQWAKWIRDIGRLKKISLDESFSEIPFKGIFLNVIFSHFLCRLKSEAHVWALDSMLSKANGTPTNFVHKNCEK